MGISYRFYKDQKPVNDVEVYDLGDCFVLKNFIEENKEDKYIEIYPKGDSVDRNKFGVLSYATYDDSNGVITNEDIHEEIDIMPIHNVTEESMKNLFDILETLKELKYYSINEEKLLFKINKPLVDEEFINNLVFEKDVNIEIVNNIKENLDSHLKNLSNEKLQSLANTTNYLDIKSILDLVCARIAYNIREMSVEDIEKEFNDQEAESI